LILVATWSACPTSSFACWRNSAATGIRTGDVIVQLDGDDVGEIGDLLSVIRTGQPGDSIAVTVLRDGREETIEVELGTAET
jgi:serine protease Do